MPGSEESEGTQEPQAQQGDQIQELTASQSLRDVVMGHRLSAATLGADPPVTPSSPLASAPPQTTRHRSKHGTWTAPDLPHIGRHCSYRLHLTQIQACGPMKNGDASLSLEATLQQLQFNYQDHTSAAFKSNFNQLDGGRTQCTRPLHSTQSTGLDTEGSGSLGLLPTVPSRPHLQQQHPLLHARHIMQVWCLL